MNRVRIIEVNAFNSGRTKNKRFFFVRQGDAPALKFQFPCNIWQKTRFELVELPCHD